MDSINTNKLYKSIHKFSDLSILVIGDIILDEYIYGDVDRISPEAPVQVVNIRYKSNVLGGAANVAHNIKDMGAKVYLVGIVGDDENGRCLEDELKKEDIYSGAIIRDPSRPTTKKTRVVADGQHIIRLDYESKIPISVEIESRINQYVKNAKKRFDAVIISDYAKGLITDGLMKCIIKELNELPVLIDPKGNDFSKYKGATTITPNKKEAFAASGLTDLEGSALKFISQLGLEAVFITLGKEGIFLAQRDGKTYHIPAMAKEVYDVSGAGDTVISSLCLSIGSGLTYYEASFLANMAAGIVVGKLGTATVTKTELLNALFLEKTPISQKIVDMAELIQIVKHLKTQGKKIVFTNGCFDIIHPGHIHLLKESKKMGDILIVAIDDDDSVKLIKGKNRPVLDQFQRAHIISSLDCVDYVIIFSTNELKELLHRIKPNIMTKGQDYSSKEVVGKDIVKQYGGSIILIPFLENNSSSQIIDKIIKEMSQK